jgi:hypothetical protein
VPKVRTEVAGLQHRGGGIDRTARRRLTDALHRINVYVGKVSSFHSSHYTSPISFSENSKFFLAYCRLSPTSFVCMYVCIMYSVCLYICIYVRMYGICMSVYMYIYICTYVRTNLRMYYVRMYLCI